MIMAPNSTSKGERDLTKLLSSLHVTRKPETFVFLTFPPTDSPPSSMAQQMCFLEAEGLTVITSLKSAREHGLEGRLPSAMITCEVHSALEGIGFLAELSNTLSRHEIPCNVVAGYYHDHLFVPEEKAAKAIEVLEELASQSQEEGKTPSVA